MTNKKMSADVLSDVLSAVGICNLLGEIVNCTEQSEEIDHKEARIQTAVITLEGKLKAERERRENAEEALRGIAAKDGDHTYDPGEWDVVRRLFDEYRSPAIARSYLAKYESEGSDE